ncbi:hypothetical protein [Nesterenkonia suensis]
MTRIIHTSGSDHISADLFADGPDTFTITGVTETTLEGEKKRHAVQLAETQGKTWVPALTVLKALAVVWSRETSNWVGQKVTLYRDESVRFGKEAVGGIRVSHITGISEPQTVEVRGAMNRRVSYTFQPLTVSPRVTEEQWSRITAAAGDVDLPALAARVAGRTLSSPFDLTQDEAEQIMNELEGSADE